MLGKTTRQFLGFSYEAIDILLGLVFSHAYPLEVSSIQSSNHSSSKISMASSSSTHPCKYDVFLSFRGEDTRRGFTDHLHKALSRHGINTFIDDQLRRGKQISRALLQAIEESRFSIIIFSQHYASSSWCLDELIKILECVNLRGHKALPVFHNVDPSDVRNQRGSYAEAFAKHEQVYKDDPEKVLKWREALTVASGLSGRDSLGRYESEVIKEIVYQILNEWIDVSSSHMEGLVGMDSCLQDMVSLLCLESDDVRMVGLWGMAGIGKTTIAEVVYHRFSTQFEGCCFLSNVREKSQKGGLTDLQMELLSQILGEANQNTKILLRGNNYIKRVLCSMKVLIVFDDVNHRQQLEALAGNHDWFGSGSRIIITTRDKSLLTKRKVDEIYKVKELARDKALTLFCQHAFEPKPRMDHSLMDGFVGLCDHALNYTKGIPLALKVLGSFLYSRSKAEWKSELEKLKVFPNKEIQDVLRISFDGLDDNEKYIFLDIAFFFIGQDKNDVTKILKSCGFFPGIGINILIEKSLLTISDNKLYMHDLIQEMGREIVQQESIKYPGKRSRLSANEDVIHVLTTNTGTEAVEGLLLYFSALQDELHFSFDVFTKMNKLRVLIFCFKESSRAWSGDYDWVYLYTNRHSRYKLHLFGDFIFLSDNLRYFCWHGYPLKSLPSNFHLEKLVELDMRFSWLEQLWEGNKSFSKLKFIELGHSQHLIKTPDFSRAPKLRRIILEDCTSLVEVHPSVGALKNLIVLNLRDCKNLESLSSSIIRMESLQILDLSGCSKFKKFPEIQGNMDHLSKLYLEGTAIKGLPSSIEHLNGLVLLNLKNCKEIASLPGSICNLTSLETLILSGCSELKKLPDNMGALQSLLKLEANGSGIQELPTSISLLTKIEELSFAGCKGWESKSRALEPLSLPSIVSSARLIRLRIPSLFSLCFLKRLNLRDCNLLEGVVSDLSSLSSLELLDLSRNSFITLPGSLSGLPRLKRLIVEECKNLQSLPELSPSVISLWADGCTSLETFPYPSSAYNSLLLPKSRYLDFRLSNCRRLVENERSGSLEAMQQVIRLVASTPDSEAYAFFHMIIPGSSIPEWFIHQGVGCSITVDLGLPPCTTSMVTGFAVCAVLSPPDWSSGPDRIPFVNKRPIHNLKDDHVWLAHVPLNSWLRSPGAAVDYFEFLFGEGVEECGVRIIYEHDVNVMENSSFLLAPCDGEKDNNQIRKPVITISHHSPQEIGSNRQLSWKYEVDFEDERNVRYYPPMQFEIVAWKTTQNSTVIKELDGGESQ